jgi:prevent-host-death family protein
MTESITNRTTLREDPSRSKVVLWNALVSKAVLCPLRQSGNLSTTITGVSLSFQRFPLVPCRHTNKAQLFRQVRSQVQLEERGNISGPCGWSSQERERTVDREVSLQYHPVTKIELVTALKRHTAKLLSDLRDSGEPVLITEHGKAAAYLVDVDSFEFMQHRLQILEGIARGERAILENRTFTQAKAKEKMKRWLV